MNLRQLLMGTRNEIGQELALYRSSARWVARRPDVPADAVPIGYARLSGPMLWLWIFGSTTEVVVVEVVLRSIEARWADVIRLPVLILGIWGVLWMLGQLAAYEVRPHLVTAGHLLIRNGCRTRVVVPLRSIASVRAAEHHYPGVVKSLHHDGDLLLVGVNLHTNLELVLDRPVSLDQLVHQPLPAETLAHDEAGDRPHAHEVGIHPHPRLLPAPHSGVVVPRLDGDPAGRLTVEVPDEAGGGSVGAATGLLEQGGVPLLLGGVAPDPAWGLQRLAAALAGATGLEHRLDVRRR